MSKLDRIIEKRRGEIDGALKARHPNVLIFD